MNDLIKEIKFNEQGLVPVIVQEWSTGKVLMLAYMNKSSFEKTIKTNRATFWSRSRQKFWVKGESSGNIQEVKDIYLDCDGDTLLLKVNQLGDNGKNEQGAACHKGYKTCFFRQNIKNKWEIIEEKMFDPEKVYEKK